MTYHRFLSKLGYITLYFADDILVGLDYEGSAKSGERIIAQLSKYIDTSEITPNFGDAEKQVQSWLERYMAGAAEQFELPMKLYGTEFQLRVWQELLKLPLGSTISYSELGEKVGCTGSRAVGTAVGRNTIPIIVPCHRVVRKDGIIGKFGAGDGTVSKIALLKIENAMPKDYQA